MSFVSANDHPTPVSPQDPIVLRPAFSAQQSGPAF